MMLRRELMKVLTGAVGTLTFWRTAKANSKQKPLVHSPLRSIHWKCPYCRAGCHARTLAINADLWRVCCTCGCSGPCFMAGEPAVADHCVFLEATQEGAARFERSLRVLWNVPWR